MPPHADLCQNVCNSSAGELRGHGLKQQRAMLYHLAGPLEIALSWLIYHMPIYWLDWEHKHFVNNLVYVVML